MINNAGLGLTVISIDADLKETAYTVLDKEIVRIKVPYRLRIEHDGETWEYELPSKPLPQHFRKRDRGNWYIDTFQIQKGGRIYLLLPDSKGPVANLPLQPEGYPLRPR